MSRDVGNLIENAVFLGRPGKTNIVCTRSSRTRSTNLDFPRQSIKIPCSGWQRS